MSLHPALVLATALAWSATVTAADGPIPVTLVQQDGAWQLLRDGKPFAIHGAGGSASLALLAKIGGNANRTWGAEGIQDVLDDAQRNGVAMAVGIWLGHERHGFKYSDPAQVQRQFEMAKAQVLKWKDHPATLVWGLGNEMEGYEAGDNPAIWTAIEAIAKMVKELDPKHPTMTTVAEIGGKRVEAIHKHCPSIDIVGINSYGGCTSIPARYVKAGGTKPYIVTEYGPPGTWEIGKNAIGAVDEPTSTAKAAFYKASHDALLADKALCLGSFAFTWGSKIEATATWYGLVTPDGAKLETVDQLAVLWGHPVANRCPQIGELRFAAGKCPTVKPGEKLSATCTVTDPEGDALTSEWVLAQELSNYNTGGDAIDHPPTFPEAILASGVGTCDIAAPEAGGVYRLYTTVWDGKGGAALSNATFRVDGPALPPKARKVKLPALVAGEPNADLWAASGYMGDTGSIKMEADCTDQPKVGPACLKVSFTSAKGWGGVVWQSPANDWGTKPGGFNLNGAGALKFWVRGAEGGEKIKFGAGILGNDKPFGDSAKVEQEVTLTTEWQEVVLDAKGRDLSRIKTGFMWTGAAHGKPFAFFLDHVRWE